MTTPDTQESTHAMIPEFVAAFDANREKLLAHFTKERPENYAAIVKALAEVLPGVDAKRIHEIDDGGHEGTLIYLIPEKESVPTNYWYVRVSYGSCSGCDMLEAIKGYSDNAPTERQAKDYLGLALNIVQELRVLP